MNKKEKILLSSLKILSEKGFENTKLEDIARDAGVGKGTLYLYFKDKDDLYISSITYLMHKWAEDAGKIIEQEKDALSKLEIYIERTLESIINNKAFARIIMRELPNYVMKAKKQNIKLPLKMYAQRRDHLIKIIKQGIREKVFINVESDIMANIIIGSLNSFMMTYIIESNDIDKDKMKSYKRIIIDMLKKED